MHMTCVIYGLHDKSLKFSLSITLLPFQQNNFIMYLLTFSQRVDRTLSLNLRPHTVVVMDYCWGGLRGISKCPNKYVKD